MKLNSPEAIKEEIFAFQKIRIILSSYELDIFTALGNKNKTSAEIAKILSLPEKSADRLLNALCVLGLVKKQKNNFTNSSTAARYLDKNSPDFLVGLAHYEHLWKSWSTLTEALQKGKSVFTAQRNKRSLEGFINAMHERAGILAKNTVRFLDLSGVKTILDVGGGSGAFSIEFARKKRELKVTLFDLPQVLPISQGFIKKENLQNSIKTKAGNYLTDDLGQGFDMVFLSAIIHSNSYRENLKLVKKCAKSLNPGGQLVVSDFIMDPTRTKPAFGAIFSLNMLVNTQNGDTYTKSEILTWMKNAGLTDIKKKQIDQNVSLMIGK